MKTHSSHSDRLQPRVARHRWWSAPAAFLCTLLAATANAGIAIPDSPLTTSTRVPSNIMFILDDSGSMAWDFMPGAFDSSGFNAGNALSTAPVNFGILTYARNTLYYNPNTTYRPWTQADGNLMTGGTSYTSVYTDTDFASGATANLASGTRVFYVPKTGATNLADAYQYYRYQIIAGTDVVRSEYGSPTVTNPSAGGYPISGLGGHNLAFDTHSVVVPARTTQMVITTAGGTWGSNGAAASNGNGAGAELYVRYNAPVSTLSYDQRATGGNNTHTITINNPTVGTWNIGIAAALGSGYRNVVLDVKLQTNDRCIVTNGSANDWINCTSTTPTGRSVADELTNFATWYSYHRTRMKVAKSGAGAAFSDLPSDVRVGYRTIWNRSNFDIPVASNNGLFSDVGASTNRTTWYDRLYNAEANNGTPLRSALTSAGTYFSGNTAAGPYGPEVGTNQLMCRQNFSILTTDGYWNSDGGFNSAGNQDGTAGALIRRPTGSPFPDYTYAPSAPYQDGYSNTLADVAMRYWKNDLRTDMDNIVPTTTDDPAFWQHMVTFGIAIGLSGRTGYTNVAAVPTTFNAWQDANGAEDERRIDDLLHAAVNSRGTFLSAGDPQEFTQGLKAALANIVERVGSFSNVASNSATLDTGSQVFNASYISNVWTGQLTATAVSASGIGATSWTSAIPAYATRSSKIFTSQAGVGASFPTAAQLVALTRTGGPVNFPVTGAQNAAYLAGDTTRERRNGGNLRNRTTLLGDIIGSSPAYSKETNTVFIGANDGMLHAFDATDGSEVFAYVPAGVNITNLATLSRPDYGHHYFVDGPVSVSARSLHASKNILVGTLGKGGKGVFALDVTDPSTFSASNVKWEMAETPGNNMGLVLGKPVLARVKTSSTATTAAAVVSNGPNSTNERAVLVVANLDTGAIIREINTGVGSAATPNGLFSPVGVFGSDGKTLSYVYAGDMLGNLWKFTLTDPNPANWTATRLFTADHTVSAGPPAVKTAQPITGGIGVAINPYTFERWVFFGTGRYLTAADGSAASTAVQAMYGFPDRGTGTVSKSDLVQRTMTATADLHGYKTRAFEPTTPLPAGKIGWYVNLPESGERIVQDAQVVSSVLVTASMIPTGSACEADGKGYVNALDAFTGTSASLSASYFDLDRDGSTTNELVTVGGTTVPVGSINVGNGMPTLPNLLRGLLVVGGSGGGGMSDPMTKRATWTRVSWREIRKD